MCMEINEFKSLVRPNTSESNELINIDLVTNKKHSESANLRHA